MNFDYSAKTLELQSRLAEFMDAHIYPNETRYFEEVNSGDRWATSKLMEELKTKAKAADLWNWFLPELSGLSNLEYAPMAELMGRVIWAAEVFNCSAPDTGNMEVLDRYGTPEQKQKYLVPLLEGRIRSSYCMTEPEVASSDATNVQTRIERDGNHYVITGRKWFISNAYHPNNGVYIVMGKTDPSAPLHLQQSQILVDPSTPGIRKVRPVRGFNYVDAPKGYGELIFDGVRVPAENLILGEGRGLEISQGRLGPGRIHHCMRIIGHSERLLEVTCRRLVARKAFGKA